MYTVRAQRATFSSLAEIDLTRDWTSGEHTRLSMADGGEVPSDLETAVRCFRTDNAFYAVFRACFRELRVLPRPFLERPTKTLRLWEQSDVLELFIGSEARSTRIYGEFQIAPDGRWLDTRVSFRGTVLQLDTAWDSGLQAASFVDHERRIWRAALRVPWISLCPDDPAKHAWEGNCYRATGRFHGEELLAWAPTGYGEGCFHRPEQFGTFQLE